jgi:hypothetical protein
MHLTTIMSCPASLGHNLGPSLTSITSAAEEAKAGLNLSAQRCYHNSSFRSSAVTPGTTLLQEMQEPLASSWAPVTEERILSTSAENT